MTYDRKVLKYDPAVLRAAHEAVIRKMKREMTMRRESIIAACGLCAGTFALICPAAGAGPVRPVEEFFPLADVRLTGGLLGAQQEQTHDYLLRLEPDRLLSRFRSNFRMRTILWISRITGAIIVIIGIALFGQGAFNVVFKGMPIM